MRVSIPKSSLDRIIATFDLKVENFEMIKTGIRELSVFLQKDLKTFVFYTKELGKVGSMPHIVGTELNKIMVHSSAKVFRGLNKILEGSIKRSLYNNSLLLLNVLRAGPGYGVKHATKKLFGRNPKDLWIRPTSYTEPQKHKAVRRVKIVFEDFSSIPKNRSLTIIKPDTEATGQTSEAVIKRLIQAVEERNSQVERLITYGFASHVGISKLRKLSKKFGFELVPTAVCCMPSLAYNDFDMPLYGLDLSFYEAEKKRKLVKGCYVPHEVLEEMLPLYPPGIDMPGDWSERQLVLLTKPGEKSFGGVFTHLKVSFRRMKKLLELSKKETWFEHWHERIFKQRLRELRRTMLFYLPFRGIH
ncbi:MAG: hypothetical protein J7K98_02225 [Candidatus Aenigmarchaeota archaeon]|nr:hypothetical protein [Candidatus Aenigmarchaeota archaeon]